MVKKTSSTSDWNVERIYTSLIEVYNLPRLLSKNFNRSNKRKYFHIKKDMKHRNNEKRQEAEK